jgi:glycosyltransferase involved in cell wall biosynthesis
MPNSESHSIGSLAAPQIAPVPSGVERPFWSVMIPTYNCARYLKQTLESVLAQDPGPDRIQIEVVDDVSTKDDPEAVVREIGKGRVHFFRNPQNIGAPRNFNSCIGRAKGRWVHILHGDDYVLPGFYTSFESIIQSNSNISAVFSRAFVVNENDELEGLSARLKSLESCSFDPEPFLKSNPFLTPTVAIKRDFYEANGGFQSQLIHVADWELFVRAIAKGGAVAMNRPLAVYRYFPANDTNRLMRTGDNLRDYLRLSELFSTQYPSFDKQQFRDSITMLAQGQIDRYARLGDKEAVRSNKQLWDEVASFQFKLKWRMRRIAKSIADLVFFR